MSKKQIIIKVDGVWWVLIGTALLVSLAWVFLSLETSPIAETEEQPAKMEAVKTVTKPVPKPATNEHGEVVLHLKGRFQ